MGRVDQARLRSRPLELPQVRGADEDYRFHRTKAEGGGGKDSPPLWLMERGIRSRTASGSGKGGRLRW